MTLSISPFLDLPLELQLKILSYCLIAPVPLFNCGIPVTGHTHRPKPRSEDKISINILLTSRFFHIEGQRILFQQNVFLYIHPFTTSQDSSIASRQTWLPQSLVSNLRHLALQPAIGKNQYQDIDELYRVGECVIEAPLLETLSIHFHGSCKAYRRWRMDLIVFLKGIRHCNDEFIIQMKQQRRDLRSWQISNGGLKVLIIKGLPDHGGGIFFLKELAHLLHKDGSLGIRMGKASVQLDGMNHAPGTSSSRHNLQDLDLVRTSGITKLRQQPDLTWIKHDKISSWVAARRGIFQNGGLLTSLMKKMDDDSIAS